MTALNANLTYPSLKANTNPDPSIYPNSNHNIQKYTKQLKHIRILICWSLFLLINVFVCLQKHIYGSTWKVHHITFLN